MVGSWAVCSDMSGAVFVFSGGYSETRNPKTLAVAPQTPSHLRDHRSTKVYRGTG